jgi:hypothetical protein
MGNEFFLFNFILAALLWYVLIGDVTLNVVSAELDREFPVPARQRTILPWSIDDVGADSFVIGWLLPLAQGVQGIATMKQIRLCDCPCEFNDHSPFVSCER